VLEQERQTNDHDHEQHREHRQEAVAHHGLNGQPSDGEQLLQGRRQSEQDGRDAQSPFRRRGFPPRL